MNRIRKKLRGQAGETIAETLVALLISVLALTMLAGAVSTASRIITQSEERMKDYYSATDDMVNRLNGATAETSEHVSKSNKTVSIKAGDTEAVYLPWKDADGKLDLQSTPSITCYTNNVFAGKPIVAYRAGGTTP